MSFRLVKIISAIRAEHLEAAKIIEYISFSNLFRVISRSAPSVNQLDVSAGVKRF
jgi:hypothetical protein